MRQSTGQRGVTGARERVAGVRERVAGVRGRVEWRFFAELGRADRGITALWWALIGLRGLLPAGFAVATGLLVADVQRSAPIAVPLVAVGVVFVVLQVLAPVQGQVSAALGDLLTGELNDRVLAATLTPPGLAHLESPDLIDDLTVARDFELGYSGPPMSLALAFIASGLTTLVVGIGQLVVLAAYRWWAVGLLGGAWAASHRMLRTPTVWDRLTGELLEAQRQTDYAYRLATDPPAAKEVRVFGLSGWVVDRFIRNRRRLVDLRWESARLGRGQVLATVLMLVAANAVFFGMLARDASAGRIGLAGVLVFAQAGVGSSALGFGGLNWSLPPAAHAVAAVRRLREPMQRLGAMPSGTRSAAGMPAVELRLRDVGFAYPARPDSPGAGVLNGLDLVVPAGSSLAVVGVNGAGKTTLVKLLCRLYDPTSGGIEVDGVDLRELDLESWRERVTAVFQDYVKYELTLRENVAPRDPANHGATDHDRAERGAADRNPEKQHQRRDDDEIRAALAGAGAGRVADLDTVLAAGYDGGVDLSGGQWQRVALARVLYAVGRGAGLVILDEPTAQLDVRGEAEIFERILTATRGCTTILISHRFSTVRHADRICVLEAGRVVEFGSHDELIAAGGRYRTMFDLQASRFAPETGTESEVSADV